MTSATAINNTFHSGLANLVKFVRNVTTPTAGTGTTYQYPATTGPIYYTTNVPAKPGETLEYLLEVTNTGTGDVTSSVVTDALPTSYATLKTGAYTGGEVTYVADASVGTAVVYTAVADSDQATYNASTLTVNLGAGATSSAGGTISTGKTALVLYQVTLN
jgi:uncharacterized repeat protein (TIGR01451 family)